VRLDDADVQSYPNFLVSFGRAGSGEDVSETGREERNEDMQCLAEFRTAKSQKSESCMRDCGLYKYVSRMNSTRESKKLSALLFFQFIFTKVGVEQVRHFST
jgi:hypothetical protein